MKPITSPNSIRDYLTVDKRKYDVQLSNKVFHELVMKVLKLEKQIKQDVKRTK